MTLNEYAALYEGLLCRWDAAPLSGVVSHYDHDGGDLVAGFAMPQWISMPCSKCGYEWGLRKIEILKGAYLCQE